MPAASSSKSLDSTSDSQHLAWSSSDSPGLQNISRNPRRLAVLARRCEAVWLMLAGGRAGATKEAVRLDVWLQKLDPDRFPSSTSAKKNIRKGMVVVEGKRCTLETMVCPRPR